MTTLAWIGIGALIWIAIIAIIVIFVHCCKRAERQINKWPND